MTDFFDVIVVGGGAVGAACARELAVAGRKVLVLDRGTQRGEAWQAAAGMLAPQMEGHGADALVELGLAGREYWRSLAGPLRDRTGIDVGFWQEGIARLAVSEEEAVELRQRVAWQRQHGHLIDWLDAVEVKDRWPWTGPAHGALWAPREGALDPQRLVEALLADAARHGATIVRDEIVAVATSGGRVTGVTGRETYVAPQVVLAAGAWSGRLRGLPRPLSVEPVRGQMAAFPWPAGVPRCILYARDCYLVHRAGEAVVGSTMEYAEYDVEVTAAGLQRLTAALGVLCPPLRDAAPLRTWAGLRPMTPDGLPILGREPRVDGLWYATGHGRNGILLAGVSGLVLRQLLDGEPPEVDIAPFAPERFWRW